MENSSGCITIIILIILGSCSYNAYQENETRKHDEAYADGYDDGMVEGKRIGHEEGIEEGTKKGKEEVCDDTKMQNWNVGQYLESIGVCD